MDDVEAAERRCLEAAAAPFVADVRATLDREFRLAFELEDDLWCFRAYESTAGVCSREAVALAAGAGGQAELTALVAEVVPDFAFDDVLEPWPRCPRHHDHPLYPAMQQGRAAWVCRRPGGGRICEIGSLVGPG
jgi:hypothetical protein